MLVTYFFEYLNNVVKYYQAYFRHFLYICTNDK